MKRLRRRSFTVEEILHWADIYREATGRWPNKDSGPILLTKGLERWSAVDRALRHGLRGLAGGSSLAQLLTERRGVRNSHKLPALSEEQILHWADEHQRRTGVWPTRHSGTIPDSGGEEWESIDNALHQGARTLAGGTSLARLLGRERGVRNRKRLPPLTEESILAWADAHHQRTGAWPKGNSGPIVDAPGETWTGVNVALRSGIRHLPGGTSLALINGSRGLGAPSSLARLLARYRGKRSHLLLPPLSEEGILADAHYRRTGTWPNVNSGPIAEADGGETWRQMDAALRQGHRRLPGDSSLLQLLVKKRGVRDSRRLPHLTEEITIRAACDCVRQAALGLQHAHEHQLIHRDLKPQNLMRTAAGQIKILDFGLARAAQGAWEECGERTGSGVILGTPDYMAPEQADDASRVDIRADIYSLGCTLYHFLGGRVPFPGRNTLSKLGRHAQEQPTPLDQLRPRLPSDLVQVVVRMMAKDPAARYQKPVEVVAALEPWCQDQPETVELPKCRRASVRRFLRHRWLLAATFLAMGGLATYFLHAWLRSSGDGDGKDSSAVSAAPGRWDRAAPTRVTSSRSSTTTSVAPPSFRSSRRATRQNSFFNSAAISSSVKPIALSSAFHPGRHRASPGAPHWWTVPISCARCVRALREKATQAGQSATMTAKAVSFG